MTKTSESWTATILLADSTSPDVSVFVRELENSGYRVLLTHHGREALEQACIVFPDLILLDAIMPGMDGFETCRRFKANAKTSAIPVIFMTALGDTNETVNAFAAGAADCVTKPLDMREVLERIQIHIGVSRARHQTISSEPASDVVTRRAMLFDRLQMAIAQAHRQRKLTALLRVGIRDWKEIRASIDGGSGEGLLRSIAERIQKTLRENDTVIRLNGSEFAIVISEFAKSYNAVVVADKIFEAISWPFKEAEGMKHPQAHIGISLYPADGVDADALIRSAEKALERARESERDYEFFTAALNVVASERLDLVKRLGQAISRHELVVYYQPQVEMDTGKIIGIEALMRWRNGKRVVACDEFLSVAEESGLIFPMGEWLLRQACKHFATWRKAAGADLRLAVNFSLRQFDRLDFVDRVKHALDQAGVPASGLDVEVTEGVLMRQMAQNRTTVERLLELGAQVAIDDFGAGPDGLSCLRHFNVNALKIDRSLISGIGRDKSDENTIVAMLAMGKSLGKRLVAEGVESQRQAEFLRRHGCTVAQGFYFGKPMPADSLTDLIKEQSLSSSLRMAARR